MGYREVLLRPNVWWKIIIGCPAFCSQNLDIKILFYLTSFIFFSGLKSFFKLILIQVIVAWILDNFLIITMKKAFEMRSWLKLLKGGLLLKWGFLIFFAWNTTLICRCIFFRLRKNRLLLWLILLLERNIFFTLLLWIRILLL